MKRVLSCLIVLVSLFIFNQNVFASSFSLDFVGNEKFNNEILLELEVKDIKDFTGVCNGLCGLVGELSYDQDKIELVDITSLDDFELMNGKKIVLSKSNGVKSGTKILSLKFKNKSLNDGESTKVSFNDIVASDGDNDIKTESISKNIIFVEDISDLEENDKIKKKINYLSSLEISAGEIEFSKYIFEYEVFVDYSVDVIEINASAESSNVRIEGLGKHDLKFGNNKIEIKVISDDGVETIYTLNVNRAESAMQARTFEVEEQVEKKSNVFIYVSGVALLGVAGYIIYRKKKNSM